MNSFLSQFKPELKEKQSGIDKKILCIIEGKTELEDINNIVKMYSETNYE